jgi:hypothetical protein
MRPKHLTYAQLKYLMEELGYKQVRTNERAVILENPEFDASQTLPAAKDEDTAPNWHLVTLRKISIEKGIVEEDEFEDLLAKAYCYTNGANQDAA